LKEAPNSQNITIYGSENSTTDSWVILVRQALKWYLNYLWLQDDAEEMRAASSWPFPLDQTLRQTIYRKILSKPTCNFYHDRGYSGSFLYYQMSFDLPEWSQVGSSQISYLKTWTSPRERVITALILISSSNVRSASGIAIVRM
jgi:hypothetical protein